MEADINGPQRKIVANSIRPVKRAHGADGIVIREGKTLPFIVIRSWSAPAGRYPEQWFLVDPKTREVLYEAPSATRLVWGLQSLTEFTSEVSEPIPLEPGTYLVVFALGGLKGGEAEVEVREAGAEVAA